MRPIQSHTSDRRQLLRVWGRYTMLAALAGTGAALLFKQPAESHTEPWCDLQAPCRDCRSLARCQRPEATRTRAGRSNGGDNG
jgi:hypothetical protein